MPFFTISGSDFGKSWEGLFASRCADMFEQAKKHAPCHIFIDEIRRRRTESRRRARRRSRRAEQTLTQLLVEMTARRQ